MSESLFNLQIGKEEYYVSSRQRLPEPGLFRHRLGEHQAVSVQIHDVELQHPVLLRTELTRYFHSRQRRVLRMQCFHVVGEDVHVPRLALAPPRIIRRQVPRLLLQEYLDLIATQDRETRRIILG